MCLLKTHGVEISEIVQWFKHFPYSRGAEFGFPNIHIKPKWMWWLAHNPITREVGVGIPGQGSSLDEPSWWSPAYSRDPTSVNKGDWLRKTPDISFVTQAHMCMCTCTHVSTHANPNTYTFVKHPILMGIIKTQEINTSKVSGGPWNHIYKDLLSS